MNGQLQVGASIPAPAQNNGVRSGHGRLMADAMGRLHQVHGVLGLIRLSDGQVVAAPSVKSYLGDTVRVGLTSSGGYPLADAAFDPNDPAIVYVAPVQIDPPGSSGNGCPYRAIAKLQLTGSGNYNVLACYGANPYNGSTVRADDCVDYAYTPDASRIREIEVDAYGNLFAASAQGAGDYAYLLIDPADGGNEIRVSLAGQVEAPAALHVSGDKLYVSTSLDSADHAGTVIHRYSIVRNGPNATNLTHDATIAVTGLRFITAMATNLSLIHI